LTARTLVNPSLATNEERERLLTWVMRSFAVLGSCELNAKTANGWFRDRLPERTRERFVQILGKADNGDLFRPTPPGRRRVYVTETNLTRFIGELVANTDCIVKMIRLGLLPPGDINYVWPDQLTANEAALSLYPTARLTRSLEQD